MAEPIIQNDPQRVRKLHELYCQCTGQNLSLRFDRERLWYEFLRAGFNAADLSQVIAYLQKEIRAARRSRCPGSWRSGPRSRSELPG